MPAREIGRLVTRRSFTRTAALGLASGAGSVSPLTVAAAAEAPTAKRFTGTTIRVSMFDTAFPRGLEKLVPQFSDLTGWPGTTSSTRSSSRARTNAMTAPVAIVNFMNYAGWDWGRITAGSIIVALPVIAFSVPVRRYLISGLTAGAVKG